jgi:hypothetical protein
LSSKQPSNARTTFYRVLAGVEMIAISRIPDPSALMIAGLGIAIALAFVAAAWIAEKLL